MNEPLPPPDPPGPLMRMLMVAAALVILGGVLLVSMRFGHWLSGSPKPPPSASSQETPETSR